MKHYKKAKNITIWFFIFICCTLSFRISSEIELLYSTVSLRYATPLASAQINKARNYSSSNANQMDISLTFWLEQKVDIQTYYKNISAINIAYLGEGKRAYNVDFIVGSYPSESDLNGCAVSDTIAWSLWASTDIIGQKLTYNKQDYLVRGVFKDSKNIIINNADNKFTAVELYSADHKNLNQHSNSFAISSGLGVPFQVVNGTDIVSLAQALCFIPIILALIFLFNALRKYSCCFKKATQQIIWFTIAFSVTIFLPHMLSKIPEWIIPTMWSDFSFWGSLLQILKNKVYNWFTLIPTTKDATVKFLLLYQVTLCFIESMAVYHKACAKKDIQATKVL